MQQHYSTVAGDEVRAGLAKVISLAGFTAAEKVEGGDPGGDRVGLGEDGETGAVKKTA
jgi:hypothetical protein